MWRQIRFLTAVNRVEHGAVLSPALFCVHTHDLLKLLCDAGFGFYLRTQFIGAPVHPNDLVVIALTANTMHKMLAICDDYALQYRISLTTANQNDFAQQSSCSTWSS